MVTTRDLTEQQFLAALKRHGIGRPEFMGYCQILAGIQASKFVCRYNGGDRRRDQLAHLIECQRRERERVEAGLRS